MGVEAPTAAPFQQCNPATTISTNTSFQLSLSNITCQDDELIPLGPATAGTVPNQDHEEPFRCNYYYSDNLCFDVSLQI